MCVLAGTPPIEIVLQQRVESYKLRALEDAEAVKQAEDDLVRRNMDKWQEQWCVSDKERTTFDFFKDVRGRMKAKWYYPNSYSTHILTNHGNFRERYHSLGLV